MGNVLRKGVGREGGLGGDTEACKARTGMEFLWAVRVLAVWPGEQCPTSFGLLATANSGFGSSRMRSTCPVSMLTLISASKGRSSAEKARRGKPVHLPQNEARMDEAASIAESCWAVCQPCAQ